MTLDIDMVDRSTELAAHLTGRINAQREPAMDVIKVSAHSRSTAVAGAIAGVMRDHKHAEVQAIGASAVNQAIKAIAIARNYLLLDGIDIVCYPEFVEIDIEGKDRTAVKMIITPRNQV
jgi:stage V sporulation protein S